MESGSGETMNPRSPEWLRAAVLFSEDAAVYFTVLVDLARTRTPRRVRRALRPLEVAHARRNRWAAAGNRIPGGDVVETHQEGNESWWRSVMDGTYREWAQRQYRTGAA
jgi:hypothetical protein